MAEEASRLCVAERSNASKSEQNDYSARGKGEAPPVAEEASRLCVAERSNARESEQNDYSARGKKVKIVS